MDEINFFAERVRRLEKTIPATRKKILAGPACSAYFVIFNSQKDAAIAAQANIHPEDGNRFRIKEAPGPEEVRRQPRHLLLFRIRGDQIQNLMLLNNSSIR